MERIYRTYADTEVVALGTYVECPHCGEQWIETDADECGTTYTLTCDGCEMQFEMHFDADYGG